MSNNIIINSTNIVSKSNNKFKYTMPREMEFKKGDKIAISHLNVYYSIFNITQKYNNNKFFYKCWATTKFNNIVLVINKIIHPRKSIFK